MKRRGLTLSRRQAVVGVLFLLPFLIHFALFQIYPFFSTAYTSFTDASLMSLEEHFVGLKNYQDVMKDRLFLTSLKTPPCTWSLTAWAWWCSECSWRWH